MRKKCKDHWKLDLVGICWFLADYSNLLKLKAPTWTRHDLQEAIEAVVTQKMRFTQASAKYGIPKGTLYDNILGKSKRMMVLEEAGLDPSEESAVLEFCCDTSIHPYNRRTKKSLNTILNFVEKIRRERDPNFMFTGLSGFRWWWAFCKKHSIVSLYFNDENEHEWFLFFFEEVNNSGDLNVAIKPLKNLINYHFKNSFSSYLIHILREKCSFNQEKIKNLINVFFNNNY